MVSFPSSGPEIYTGDLKQNVKKEVLQEMYLPTMFFLTASQFDLYKWLNIIPLTLHKCTFLTLLSILHINKSLSSIYFHLFEWPSTIVQTQQVCPPSFIYTKCNVTKKSSETESKWLFCINTYLPLRPVA